MAAVLSRKRPGGRVSTDDERLNPGGFRADPQPPSPASPPKQEQYPDFVPDDKEGRHRWDLCVAVAAQALDEPMNSTIRDSPPPDSSSATLRPRTCHLRLKSAAEQTVSERSAMSVHEHDGVAPSVLVDQAVDALRPRRGLGTPERLP